MKKTGLVWTLCCASACFLTNSAFAQADAGTPAQPGATQTSNDRESGKSKQFCRSKDLVGATVKDSQGEKVGDIKEIMLNPQNSQAFASIDIGQSRHAVVPVQALTVMPPRGAFHNAEVTINKTKADLESAPTVTRNEWHNLDDASFTQRIYSYYNIQPPAAVGGTGAPSAGSSGTSSSSSKTSSQP